MEMKIKSVELISTRKNKPSLVVNGYEHRVHRKNEKIITWLCSNERKQKCRGGVKTDLEHKVLSMTTHCCVPNEAKTEIKKTMERCKQRIRAELSYPVYKIFREEISEFHNKGYHLLTEAPKYENVKTSLCEERRRVLRATQNPTNNTKNESAEETDSLPKTECLDNSSKTTFSDDNNETSEVEKTSSLLNETPEHVECSVDYHPSQFSEEEIEENQYRVALVKGKEENTSVNTQKKRKLITPEAQGEAQHTSPQFDQMRNDEFSVYGEYVANELRKLSIRAQAVAKHNINNILFEATIGNYDSPSSNP